MMVWLDIETTGLDPKLDRILEIGFVLTDDDLVEKVRFQRVVDQDLELEIDPRVVAMHTENHLFADMRRHGSPESRVVEAADAFLNKNLGAPMGNAILCGSSIDFDRSFLRAHPLFNVLMPYFTYRMIDVSTVKELARRWSMAVHDKRPADRKKHRVIPDIEDSIAEIRYYRENLFR